jgi:RNA polymerase sigma factor (sigma-70 family)
MLQPDWNGQRAGNTRGPEGRTPHLAAIPVERARPESRPTWLPGAGGVDPSAADSVIAAAYVEHYAAIRGTALRLTRDPDLAADVTQEAFLRLLLEARAGRAPDDIRPWLHRTTANLIISRARRAAVARHWAPRLVRLDGPAEPDAIVVQREERSELRIALATLPATDRVVLLMAAQGATGQEIARHVGRTPAATRTLLCRARIRLRAAATGIDAGSAVPAGGAPSLPANARHPVGLNPGAPRGHGHARP